MQYILTWSQYYVKRLKLIWMHQISVICDSEQFSGRKNLYKERPHREVPFYQFFSMMTLFSFLNFREKSGIPSWFLPYFLNLYELLIYQEMVTFEFHHFFPHIFWLPIFSNDIKKPEKNPLILSLRLSFHNDSVAEATGLF